MADRLIGALKGAIELNLRYSSVVLNLAKDYVRDIERVVRNPETPAGQPTPQAPRRAPILLVGELGEVASGAFALNNTADSDLNVTLVVQGELDPAQVEVTPAGLVLPAGRGAYVRLKVPLTEALEADRDYFGAVLAPGLSNQAVEFVVRRLPGAGKESAGRKPAAARRPRKQ